MRSVIEMAERGSNVDHFDRIRIRRAIRFADTTVGGLVMARLRRLPRVDDEIVEGGFRFRVQAVSGPAITLVAVERDRPQAAEQRRRRWPRIGKN
jgi:CBS domain containing-hemolysin-like protein